MLQTWLLPALSSLSAEFSLSLGEMLDQGPRENIMSQAGGNTYFIKSQMMGPVFWVVGATWPSSQLCHSDGRASAGNMQKKKKKRDREP